MTFHYDWKIGDYAYITTDTSDYSAGDVVKVTRIYDDMLGKRFIGFGMSHSGGVVPHALAPVLRGRDLPSMPYGGRLAEIFPTDSEHGYVTVVPEGSKNCGIVYGYRYYAVLEVFDAPDPNKQKIRALRETIETAQQQIRELEEA